MAYGGDRLRLAFLDMTRAKRTTSQIREALLAAIAGLPGAETIFPRVYPEKSSEAGGPNWNANYAQWGRPLTSSNSLTSTWQAAVVRLRAMFDLAE